jgi:hypothetical protein
MEMTPEKLAFIKRGSEAPNQTATKPGAATSVLSEKTIDVSTPQAEAESAKESKPRGPRRTSSRSRQDAPESNEILDQVLVPVTIRLPHRIAHALKRAYLEQRLKYAKPDTQQEIAEEALTDWLTKSGYLE